MGIYASLKTLPKTLLQHNSPNHCSEKVTRTFSKCNSPMDQIAVKLHCIQTIATTTTRITTKWVILAWLLILKRSCNKFYSGSPLSFIKYFKAGKEFKKCFYGFLWKGYNFLPVFKDFNTCLIANHSEVFWKQTEIIQSNEALNPYNLTGEMLRINKYLNLLNILTIPIF